MVGLPCLRAGDGDGVLTDRAEHHRVELTLGHVQLVARLVDGSDVVNPRRVVGHAHVLAVAELAVLVVLDATEAHRQRLAVTVEVRDRKATDEAGVTRERVSDDAKPERTRRLSVDPPLYEVASGLPRNGCLVARCRLLQLLPLRGRERLQWLLL